MKIRTVFQPDEEIEVPDEEAEVLRLNGLLHTPAPEPAPAAAKAPEPKAPVPRPPSTPAADSPVAAGDGQSPSTEKG